MFKFVAREILSFDTISFLILMYKGLPSQGTYFKLPLYYLLEQYLPQFITETFAWLLLLKGQ